eukprot:3846987-Heterocapsa_arctica.AAC.1
MREQGLRRVGLGGSSSQEVSGGGIAVFVDLTHQEEQDREPAIQPAQEGEGEDGGNATQEPIGPGFPPTLSSMAEAEKWRKHARWAGHMATEAAERACIFTGSDPQSQDQGTQTDSTSSPSDH